MQILITVDDINTREQFIDWKLSIAINVGLTFIYNEM